MSLESVMQRMQEIQSLMGPVATPAVTQPQTSTAFASMLAQAQSTSGSDEAALPDTSMASSLPQYGANLSSYGRSGAAGATNGYTPYSYAGSGAPSPMLSQSFDSVGLTPYLASPLSGVSFPWTGSGDVGRRMVALAQGEVGVRESPPGSNNGARIQTYRTATAGAAGTPGPWCAYFVSWLARQSGAPIGQNGAGMGYVPNIEAWGRQTGRFAEPSLTPRPGDIVIFERNGDGVADHTGIVERVDPDGRVHTIEGNSSDMVARREYAAGTGGIRGYVRPG